MSLPEIEIQESQKKRKMNTISPRRKKENQGKNNKQELPNN